MGRGAQTEERVRFVYGFMRRSKSSTGMRRAHLFSGASGGRRSASAAVDGATAIPHLNEDTFWGCLINPGFNPGKINFRA